MKLQQIMSKTRKAVDDYKMINENETIAVGISGGKDSLALLHALSGMRRFYPTHYSLIAITCDLGFKNVNFDDIKKLCDELNVEYHIVNSDISDIVFNKRKEENPCSLCAKMRKGAMYNYLNERGINKIAYAHHQDDVVETYMMSLIYEGRQNTFSPVTYLDRSGITVIRPFIYMKEADIIGFVRANNVPVLKSPCPVDGFTKRQYAKDLLKSINDETPGVRDRIFTAIQNSNIKGWSKP